MKNLSLPARPKLLSEGGNRSGKANCQRTPIVQPVVDYEAGLKTNLPRSEAKLLLRGQLEPYFVRAKEIFS